MHVLACELLPFAGVYYQKGSVMALTISSLGTQNAQLSGSKNSQNTDNNTGPMSLGAVLDEAERKQHEAVSVNLSAEAQAYLQQAKQQLGISTSEGFQLTNVQQIVLDEILTEYADLPVTEENYALLLADLETHMLSPSQLTLQQKVTGFNSTQAFMSALNGEQVDIAAMIASYTQVDETQAEDYLVDIVGRWQALYEAQADEAQGA